MNRQEQNFSGRQNESGKGWHPPLGPDQCLASLLPVPTRKQRGDVAGGLKLCAYPGASLKSERETERGTQPNPSGMKLKRVLRPLETGTDGGYRERNETTYIG